MRAVPLKVIDTDLARDKRTGQAMGFRDDSPLFDPAVHDVFPFPYRDHYRTLLNAPMDPQRGATPDEFRKSIAILKKLVRCKGDILYLEDEEWRHLVQKIDTVPLTMIQLWIDECHEDARNAPEVSDDTLAKALDGKVSNVRDLVRA